MIELAGTYATAKVFSDTVEEYALQQILMLLNQPSFADSTVRIMPDVHPGKVGTIGFTSTVTSGVMPNVVGIDIGCGITIAQLKNARPDFKKIDTVIRENVPAGFQIRKKPHRFISQFDPEQLYCFRHINKDKMQSSLGTLGGGNHFIELDVDNSGNYYLAIHSGSRHLGKEVTDFYLRSGQRHLKEQGVNLPYELTWLSGTLKDDYIHDILIVQDFARLNRDAIIDEICKGMKWKVENSYCCAHNYIDIVGDKPILRKGAISAKLNERVVIPINMRDGIILGRGKGNIDWNESAPHGAGRIMKRSDVRSHFTVSMYKQAMKGIYSSCISKDTLDEAPFAYRGLDEITHAVTDTVYIEDILKPIYNFKAGSED